VTRAKLNNAGPGINARPLVGAVMDRTERQFVDAIGDYPGTLVAIQMQLYEEWPREDHELIEYGFRSGFSIAIEMVLDAVDDGVLIIRDEPIAARIINRVCGWFHLVRKSHIPARGDRV